MGLKKLFLYDPISNIKYETTYKKLQEIFDYNKNTLMSIKCKKLKINKQYYIIDESITNKELLDFMQKIKLDNEIWKPIQDTRYYISSYGRVKAVYKTKERLLMPYIKKGKWQTVGISVNGRKKEIPVHKLVAEYFLDNKTNGKLVLWHKNGNILDNRVDNLEWIDKETLGKKTGGKSNSIPVLKLDARTNQILDEYQSMAEAGRENYLHRETIRKCIKGDLKTAGGYKWAIDKEFYQTA